MPEDKSKAVERVRAASWTTRTTKSELVAPKRPPARSPSRLRFAIDPHSTPLLKR